MPTVVAAFVTVATAADMKPYPQAEDGMVRHALELEKQDKEENLRVELILGKTIEVDGVNRHFFGGKIERKTVEGWGYSYHILPELGPMAATRMAPRPGAPLVKKFVPIGGEPYLIRYNSKVPVVVYVPEDVEVRYRIWRADDDQPEIPKG